MYHIWRKRLIYIAFTKDIHSQMFASDHILLNGSLNAYAKHNCWTLNIILPTYYNIQSTHYTSSFFVLFYSNYFLCCHFFYSWHMFQFRLGWFLLGSLLGWFGVGASLCLWEDGRFFMCAFHTSLSSFCLFLNRSLHRFLLLPEVTATHNV